MSDLALQVLLIISFIAFSWLGFMVVHEFGHIAVAWSSGGSLSHVTHHPLQDLMVGVAPNPHPQLVAWGGPVLGSLLPLALLAVARAFRAQGSTFSASSPDSVSSQTVFTCSSMYSTAAEMAFR